MPALTQIRRRDALVQPYYHGASVARRAVRASNAAGKLAEQLAAVASLTEIGVAFGGGPAGPAQVSDLGEAAGLGVGSPQSLLQSEPGGLSGRLEHALGELPDHIRAIIAHVPDVESWSIQAGFPWGVSVTVNFKGSVNGSGT